MPQTEYGIQGIPWGFDDCDTVRDNKDNRILFFSEDSLGYMSLYGIK